MNAKARTATDEDSLARYREKRNFGITPEPAGAPSPASRKRNAARKAREQASAGNSAAPRSSRSPANSGKALQFVIQKHWARRLHYDLRLEIDGTMKSWAVPKGPSLDPAVKRMAVHVEDHPMDYNSFEGTIPAGQYGAGKVIIWDRGSWTPLDDDESAAYKAGKLKFELTGSKLRGRWALVRMGGKAASENAWLLIKEKDEAARAESQYDITKAEPDSVVATQQKPSDGTASIPESMPPQLATRVSVAPRNGDWLYELKYDGYRILARIHAGKARLHTRQGHDWTRRLPSVAAAMEAAALPDGWYDGEIVVLDEDGKPHFQALQNALDPHAGTGVRRRAAKPTSQGVKTARSQITCFLFDLPWLQDTDLRDNPLHERRARLEALLEDVDQPALRLSEVWTAAAHDLLQSACELGLEGVMGKLRTSRYTAGRSGHWIKLKCGERQEFVVTGYTDPKGGRQGFGALLLGYYDEEGTLLYAGNV